MISNPNTLILSTLIPLCLILSNDSAARAVFIRTGGDALQCLRGSKSISDPSSQTKFIQETYEYVALDIETNQVFRDIIPNTDGLSGTFMNRAISLIERLNFHDPKRVQDFKFWISDLDKKIIYEIDETAFFDIKDSNHFGVPPECKIHQLIVTERNSTTGEFTLRINARKWHLLHPNHQAYMLIHEFLYLESQSSSSFYVSYFNALIASNQVRKLTKIEYSQLLRNIGLKNK